MGAPVVRRGLYIGVPVDAPNPSTWSEDALALVAAEGVEPVLLHGLDGGAPLGAHRAGLPHDGVLRTSAACAGRDGEALGPRLPGRSRRAGVAVVGPSVRVARRCSAPFRRSCSYGRGHLGPPSTGRRDPPRRRDPHRVLEEHDPMLLVETGDRLGNRAVFKRLGYLVEALGLDCPSLQAACEERVSSGIVKPRPRWAAWRASRHEVGTSDECDGGSRGAS